MKKIFLFLLLVLSICECRSQDSLKHKLSIGLRIEGSRAFRSLTSTSELEQMKILFDSLETPILGQRYEASIGYSSSHKISFHSGISFTQLGFNIDSLKEANLFDVKFRYRLIEVPFTASIIVANLSSWNINAQLGIRTAFIVNSQFSFKSNSDRKQQRVDDKSDKISPMVMPLLVINFSKMIENNYQINFGLNHTQSITPLSKGSLHRRLFSTGIGFSIYKFL